MYNKLDLIQIYSWEWMIGNNYGIKRIIKQKTFANYILVLAELFGKDLYGVIVYDSNDDTIHFSQCYWITEPRFYINALHEYNKLRGRLIEKDYSMLY